MFRSSRIAAVAFLVAAFVSASPALAVSGVVRDVDGKPIVDADICYFHSEIQFKPFCVSSGKDGEFEIPDSTENYIRIAAKGYFPETVDAKGHHEIMLRQSPTLVVRLFDRTTGEPVDAGELMVIYPSAVQRGPFPFNRNGVKISRVLEPGEVRLLATAEGYKASKPKAVTLEAGETVETSLKLEPTSKDAGE